MEPYRVAQKTGTLSLYALTSYALTSSNIDRFSNLFHCLKQKNICNNTVTSNVSLHYLVKCVLIATTGKKDDFCDNTLNFKKLTIENNVFIVLVII